MTTYESISADNRYLFGLLEQYTYEIAFMALKNQSDEAERLQQQKNAVRGLIDANLDKLDTLWKVKRPAARHNGQIEPTLTERKIILTYQHNPDQSQGTIAKKQRCGIHQVQRTITALLDNRYLNV